MPTCLESNYNSKGKDDVKAANIITLARIALIPVFILVYMSGMSYGMYIALAIFLAASLTDKLDGYVARKYNQVSNFGKFIDPLADKLLICSALLLFLQDGRIGVVAVIIIISREFVVTSLRTVAMSAGRVVAAGTAGKIKMVVQVICTGLLILPQYSYKIAGTVAVGDVAAWVMAIVTLWSGIEYCVQNRDIILDGI